jgi:hypothetical protein
MDKLNVRDPMIVEEAEAVGRSREKAEGLAASPQYTRKQVNEKCGR